MGAPFGTGKLRASDAGNHCLEPAEAFDLGAIAQVVDKCNNAVNEMNESVEAYNNNNDLMNNNRGEYLDAWNKSVAKFTDKHVPSGKAK